MEYIGEADEDIMATAGVTASNHRPLSSIVMVHRSYDYELKKIDGRHESKIAGSNLAKIWQR